jgi:hypothetical protein
MKKIITMVFGVCFAGLLFAASTEVSSVNVVGYAKVGVPPAGFQLVALNFDSVTNADLGVPLDNLFTPGSLKGGQSVIDGDNILIWDVNAQQYVTYFYCDNTGWGNTPWGGTYDGHWFKAGDWTSYATNRLYNGDAFWIASTTNIQQTVTFQGQVVVRPTLTNALTFKEGFNMAGYPFSAAVCIDSNNMSATAKGGQSVIDGDNLMLWDTNAQQYVTFFYCDNTGWGNTPWGGTYDGHWFKAGDWSKYADEKVNIGQGFWYLRQTNAVMTWSAVQPYTL